MASLDNTKSNGNFPVGRLRPLFPALNDGENFVFFDNAAGAQIPQSVLDAVTRHLLRCNVQRGGRYWKSEEVDATIDRARHSVAALVNTGDPQEIAFGMNATSFIRLVSMAIGATLADRREIVVTDMDHEANVATWAALEADGAKLVWWKMREDGNLYLEDLEPLLSSRTRLVACTVTSNALGTVIDVAGVAKRAHAAGAELFLDCVHYGPHGAIDVQAFGCDYLVCSGYKIFAPHMGFLWGHRDALDLLPTFREDFVPDKAPTKFEVGTYVYENVAGMDAAVVYLEGLGRDVSGNGVAKSRRENIESGMRAIHAYEKKLSVEMHNALRSCGAEIYGVKDPAQFDRRVPTFLFNLPGVAPAKVVEELASAGIGARDGHMYSPRLMKRLGLAQESGAVRASLVHYNTSAEIEQFRQVLAKIAGK